MKNGISVYQPVVLFAEWPVKLQLVTFQFNDGTLVKSTRMSPVENWITDLIYGVNWNVGLVNWNVIRTKNGKPKFVKSIENR